MINILKGFFTPLSGGRVEQKNDFSAFFTKSSGDKAKVIRQALREANAEQRRVMQEYRGNK